MKKNVSSSLHKSIIDSDFFLLNSNSSQKSSYSRNHWSLNNKEPFVSLDTLELLKSLKQFIRSLQFLKSQNLNSLHINVENKEHFFLLKQFLIEYKFSINVHVHNTFSLKKVRGNGCTTDMILVLGQTSNQDTKKMLRRLYDSNVFLVNKLNSNVEANNWGTYKIFNDLFDFKKVLFMVILINEVFMDRS